MFPGMNQKVLEKAMKQLGVKQQDIDADLVIIRCKDKEFIYRKPQVTKVLAMGQESIQIIGEAEERNLEKFSEDDIKFVMEKADVDEDTAKKALEKSNGDLAEAILILKK